jgi:hypothetical protein
MQKGVCRAVEAIDEEAWQTIDYPAEGEAQIAETTHGGRRLIVRRTRLLGAQAQLWPDWRHFAFITNRTEDITIVEAEHRDHAVVEQVIADLKDQALQQFPSGEFSANGAWTVLGGGHRRRPTPMPPRTRWPPEAFGRRLRVCTVQENDQRSKPSVLERLSTFPAVEGRGR